jgi:hypothetical protein
MDFGTTIANTFGGTFAKPHKPHAQAKFCKRATKPRHQDRHEMTTNKHDRKEGRSANIGFAKWRVKCFYDSLVQGSSSVFQMYICAEIPPLRKAESRQTV